VLEPFAFAMLVGIITSTYSTVFIASAVASLLTKRPTPSAKPAPAPTADRTRRKARAS
jgi:preprotein translocase subunit SecF